MPALGQINFCTGMQLDAMLLYTNQLHYAQYTERGIRNVSSNAPRQDDLVVGLEMKRYSSGPIET